MLDQVTQLGQKKLTALNESYLYNQQVFVFPPWEEIYRQDAERDQTFFDAIRIFEIPSQWYRRCGYNLLEVPMVSVADRCDFILRELGLD